MKAYFLIERQNGIPLIFFKFAPSISDAVYATYSGLTVCYDPHTATYYDEDANTFYFDTPGFIYNGVNTLCRDYSDEIISDAFYELFGKLTLNDKILKGAYVWNEPFQESHKDESFDETSDDESFEKPENENTLFIVSSKTPDGLALGHPIEPVVPFRHR